MMFTIWSKHRGDPDSKAWSEDYNKPVSDPQAWAEETLEEFNATLRKGELPREIVRVEIKPNGVPLRHQWQKTNLVTIIKGRDNYDTYRCEMCGITAKRHGVGDIIPDRKKDFHKPCKGKRQKS
jgi:hypothetical protein